MKSLFEELGGTYRREGDYLLPNVSPQESPRLGFWGGVPQEIPAAASRDAVHCHAPFGNAGGAPGFC